MEAGDIFDFVMDLLEHIVGNRIDLVGEGIEFLNGCIDFLHIGALVGHTGVNAHDALNDCIDRIVHRPQSRGYFLAGLSGVVGQLADFVRHHRKSPSRFSCPGEIDPIIPDPVRFRNHQ